MTTTTALVFLLMSLSMFCGCLVVDARPMRTPRNLRKRGWKLVWDDNFATPSDDAGIDDSKWTYEVNCAGGGNNELQCYTDRLENAFYNASSKTLDIVARQESFTGSPLTQDDPEYINDNGGSISPVTKPFTSARLRTKDKFDVRYGRIEVLVQLAAGQGTWPAVWMLPSSTDVYGIWPLSGEIDIVEAVNLVPDKDSNSNAIEGALHYGLPWPQWKVNYQTLSFDNKIKQSKKKKKKKKNINPANGFHRYAVEWEQDEIRWYMNDQLYMIQRSNGWYNYYWQGQSIGFATASNNTNQAAPFDQAFHIIMNVAIGGDKPGPPDTSTSGWTINDEDSVASSTMKVKRVRVYQCMVKNPNYTKNNGQPKHIPSPDGSGCARKRDQRNKAVRKFLKSDAGAPGVNAYYMFDTTIGPTTLELPNAVTNTLNPGLWESIPGQSVQMDITQTSDDGFVWKVDFLGPIANIFLTSNPTSNDENVVLEAPGMALTGGSGWSINGELSFDMRIYPNGYVPSPSAYFLVKMDSVFPNVGQVAIETPPADGKWHRVAVRILELLKNPIPSGGGIDLSDVLNLFVLEYVDGDGYPISLSLRNIRLQCAYNTSPEEWQLDQLCGMQAQTKQVLLGNTLDVYVNGQLGRDFDIMLSDSGAASVAEVELSSVESLVDASETVLYFKFDENPDTNAVAFFLSTVGSLDLSSWAGGGTLQFDMFVVQNPTTPALNPWMIKVDCEANEGNCGTGDVPLIESKEGEWPTEGEWQHYTFDVDELVSKGLDLSKVHVPLVIFPSWGNQDGAEYYLKNIQWIK